ncbi:Rrf2 family transcriptional regulator [Sulfurimonas sp.]|mgnify:CR=1 FL=1|jgi:Rrf2 family transcriptional regulator, cysteine metabolism repressor|uniref:RrF2 family transcriptional regulator n=1 Tax=Sulfurimonas sp. TaxID=2022749 RepID=UPI0025F801C6|nr:Rrf2 family transcriptional regulator [Sulfurimonas sp.]MBT5935304.1 Rrf2 family transcriptional regulator [Sulfurimonas sp.]
MVGISTKGTYAIAAMHVLEHSTNNELMQIREISALTQISHGYLEQILATLRKSGFVTSVRGANGGYKLSRSPDDIIVLDVIESLEGELFTPYEEPGASVVLTAFWSDTQSQIREVFNIKLSDLDKAFEVYYYQI